MLFLLKFYHFLGLLRYTLPITFYRTKKLKKYIVLLLVCLFSSKTFANNWDYQAHGLAGAYYSVTQTQNTNKYPNRWLLRGDTSLKADYIFNNNHKTGLHAFTTIIFRENDINRRSGEYRFYPYLADTSPYGTVYLGYNYNAADILHKGARDITFLKIDNSNITSFFYNPNWNNGFKSTKYATPKSTSIITDGRAQKITYLSPHFDNAQIGFSYTPHNANRRGMTSRYTNYETPEDGYTVGFQKKWQLDAHKIFLSAGYGIFNRTDKETSLGLTWEYKNFNIAAGYKKAYIDGSRNPIATQAQSASLPALFDNYRESQAWNISTGYKNDYFKTNLAFLQTQADNTRHQDNLLIWSTIVPLNDYLEGYTIGSHLNTHGNSSCDDNDGYGLIVGFGFKF